MRSSNRKGRLEYGAKIQTNLEVNESRIPYILVKCDILHNSKHSGMEWLHFD